MATWEYQVASNNWNTANSVTLYVGDSISITGVSGTASFGLYDNSVSVAGCSYSSFGTTELLYTLFGTLTEFGTYTIKKGSTAPSSGAIRKNEGATITITVKARSTVKALSTSQPPSTVNVNGEWKLATLYVNVNGEWKLATLYVNVNGEWREGKI